MGQGPSTRSADLTMIQNNPKPNLEDRGGNKTLSLDPSVKEGPREALSLYTFFYPQSEQGLGIWCCRNCLET